MPAKRERLCIEFQSGKRLILHPAETPQSIAETIRSVNNGGKDQPAIFTWEYQWDWQEDQAKTVQIEAEVRKLL